MSTEGGGQNLAPLLALPVCVMLKILSFLCIPERIRSSRVCKLWKMLVEDFSLWRHMDLTPLKVEVPVVKQLCQRHMGPGLRSLSVGSSEIIPALIKEVRKRCPNLTTLKIHVACLKKLPISKLPQSLTSLELHNCEISKSWFLRESRFAPLPFLQHLVLDHVPAFNDKQLRSLSKLKALCSLELADIPSVTKGGLLIALSEMEGLHSLQLVNGSFSVDGLLQAVSRRLHKLQKLLHRLSGLSPKGLSLLLDVDSLQCWQLCGLHPAPNFKSAHTLSVVLKVPKLQALKFLTVPIRSLNDPDALLREVMLHCMVTVSFHQDSPTAW